MIVSHSGYMASLSQVKPTESGAISALGGNRLPVENKSSDAVQISDAARTKVLEEIESGGLVDFTGKDGLYKKGLMLGLGESTVQAWADKGLEITEEAVIAAGKTFQDAFTKMVEKSGSSLAGSALALNKHQIVINSQQVPDWFVQEYGDTLSSMGNKETKRAFENGELFVTTKPSPENADALARYSSMKK